MNWLNNVPTSLLIILSLTLGLAPFTPMPHLVEKIRMLVTGALVRPVDVFDLIMHASPNVLLILKIAFKPSSKAKG